MNEEKNYRPDDSGVTVETVTVLHSPEGTLLRERVSGILRDGRQLGVADVAQLRKDFSADVVHAAIMLEKLQASAQRKFPEFGKDIVWAIAEGLEQATDSAVARYKSRRFAEAGAKRIYDLCCGIGGDALALAAVAPTIAVDLSGVRLRCLDYNAQRLGVTIETRLADVGSLVEVDGGGEGSGGSTGTFFHLDPSRRAGGKRSAAYEDLIPGPAVIEKLIARFAGGALKLSPAVDFDSLPPGHLELISHNRSVVQAVLWIGSMGEPRDEGVRTATTLVNHAVTGSFTARAGNVRRLSEGPPAVGSHLYEVDGAVTRAGLAAALGETLHLTALTIDGGYACDVPGSAVFVHHALTGFKVVGATAFSEKRVIELLRGLPDGEPGAVEVKTRGRIPGVDTDILQKRFSKASPYRRTVLIYKSGSKTIAVAANRVC